MAFSHPRTPDARQLVRLSLLLMAMLSWGAIAAPPQLPRQMTADQHDHLRARFNVQESVRLIVGLDVDMPATPAQGTKTRQGEAARDELARGHIARIQDRLSARLPRVAAGRMRRLRNLPYVTIEADSTEFQQLLNAPEVVSIQEDIPVPPSLSSSTAVMGAAAAWAGGNTGAGQMVAILDTGVDVNHEHFMGKNIVEACFSSNRSGQSESLCPNGSGQQTGPGSAEPCASDCSHGTHVASIAVGNGDGLGRASGVAKDADLLAIQVFSYFPTYCGGNPCVLSWSSDQLAALDYVYSLRGVYDIASANLSLGGDPYTSQSTCDADNVSMKAAIDRLRSAGIATVAAAGNSGSSTGISAPGCISSAVSVGSTTDSDLVSSFSNSASWLSVYAPGSSINAAVPWSFSYGTKSGTSMASPHVAGAFAVLRSKANQEQQANISVSELLLLLQSTGEPVTRGNYTIPRIQLDAALNAYWPSADTTTIELTVGQVDTGQYGSGWGTNQHPLALSATFTASASEDLALSVNGYDIDDADEVSVWLNGAFVGYLRTGSNNQVNAGDNFTLPAAALVAGTNLIEFRQTTPGYVWGVTNLLVDVVQAGVQLAIGQLDSTQYGNGWGTDQHPMALVATFNASGSESLSLSVDGYDIDFADEVSVWLNGNLIGYLSKGANNGLNGGDMINLPTSALVSGSNTLEFRQRTEGYIWGVTNLLIDSTQSGLQLTLGQLETGQYGNGWGTDQHPVLLSVTFNVTGTENLALSVDGYDIDDASEVSVWLNGIFIGYLSTGPNNQLNAGDTFSLPASALVAGSNLVEFRERTEGYIWGVTNLLLDQAGGDIYLPLGQVDSGQYGSSWGSDQNPLVFTATFDAPSTDNLSLTVTGYDIDYADEVSVWLNGNLIGYLSKGPNNALNGGDAFVLPGAMLTSTANIIEFRQRTEGYVWGVTNLLVDGAQTDVHLTAGQIETGQFGNGWGTDQNPLSLSVSFDATTGDSLSLSVDGYDVDYADEVSVWLNGALLGYLSKGPNNALNGGDTFALTPSLLVTGSNLVEFRQRTQGYIWGVTSLLLQ